MMPITGHSQLALPVSASEAVSQELFGESSLDGLADLITDLVLPRVLAGIVVDYTIEKNRDQPVKDAIEQLRVHQGPISQHKILEAVEAFTDYLYASSVNEIDKQRAIDALLTPRKRDENFGPLINEEGFSLLGLQLSGRELIGRLWIFASQLTESEQANAKEGMISALKDSHALGERECNQAKTHRLIVAVLQGRLKRVRIDEAVITVQISSAQAMQMFFTIQAHQAINIKTNLITAANRFCDENPRVNRQAFIEEIHAYAVEQEMP